MKTDYDATDAILVAAGVKKTAEIVPLKKLPGHRKSAIS